jgi:hypothetical protein
MFTSKLFLAAVLQHKGTGISVDTKLPKQYNHSTR